YAVRRADRVMVSSKDYAAASPVVGDLHSKCVEVHPPDQTSVTLAPRHAPSRHSDIRIGFLGRFTEEKGLDVLLAAFSALRNERNGLKLVLAGEYKAVAGGSEYNRLRSAIQGLGDSVEVLGYVPDQAL